MMKMMMTDDDDDDDEGEDDDDEGRPDGGSRLLHLCHRFHSLPYILYIAAGLDIFKF